jgi:hypothetical protein
MKSYSLLRNKAARLAVKWMIDVHNTFNLHSVRWSNNNRLWVDRKLHRFIKWKITYVVIAIIGDEWSLILLRIEGLRVNSRLEYHLSWPKFFADFHSSTMAVLEYYIKSTHVIFTIYLILPLRGLSSGYNFGWTNQKAVVMALTEFFFWGEGILFVLHMTLVLIFTTKYSHNAGNNTVACRCVARQRPGVSKYTRAVAW